MTCDVELEKIVNIPFNLCRALRVVMQSTQNAFQSSFFWKKTSVNNSCLLISTCHCQIAAGVGVTLDVRKEIMQLFHHTNIGIFLLCHLESEKCTTSRLSLNLEHIPLPLETKRATHSSNCKQGMPTKIA